MQPENYNQEENQVTQTSRLHQVTSLSKYLAMALFIILPFVGGYIGYMYAPEKVVEVEKVVKVEKEQIDVVEVEAEIRNVSQGGIESSTTSEVWHLKTSFGSEFLIEPDDSYLGGSYELVGKYQLANFDYELRGTEMANLNPNLFYAVGTLEDEDILLRINTQNKTFEELVTLESLESDYAPGLALGSDDQGVIFSFPSCTSCAPVVLDKAVYLIDQNDYKIIGTTSRFEWIDGGYRYKIIPEGCDTTFNATYEPTPSEICEQKADSLDWIVVTP